MSSTEVVLYHATTPKKARLYRQTGRIIKPVRGFDSLFAAMAWSIKVGSRPIILEVKCKSVHKLPDHHNQFGEAWWSDEDVTDWKCVFNAEKDA